MDDAFPLLRARCGIYGLFYYGSAYVCSANGMGGAMHSQIRRVYDFKKTGKHKNEIADMIRAVADRLGCGEIWAVPPSRTGCTNTLQDVFGVALKRVKDAVQRKYNHNVQVDVSGLEIPEHANGKVLLVDDIATTGRSMIVLASELAKKFIESEMLVVGLNMKIVPEGSVSRQEVEDSWRARSRQEQNDTLSSDEEEQGEFYVGDLLQSLSSGTQVPMAFDVEREILKEARDHSRDPDVRLKNIADLVVNKQRSDIWIL